MDSKDTVTVEASINVEKITIPNLIQTEIGKNDWKLKVVNSSGVSLPTTGSHGIMLIYFTGVVLTALAGAGLVMKKRRKE